MYTLEGVLMDFMGVFVCLNCVFRGKPLSEFTGFGGGVYSETRN